jgi:hypothetical protein
MYKIFSSVKWTTFLYKKQIKNLSFGERWRHRRRRGLVWQMNFYRNPSQSISGLAHMASPEMSVFSFEGAQGRDLFLLFLQYRKLQKNRPRRLTFVI